MSNFSADFMRQVKQKFQIKSGGNRIKQMFIPQEGKQTIRIVPNVFQKEFPIQGFSFYWRFAGKNIISPLSFDQPDPISDFIEQNLIIANAQNNKELWKKYATLKARPRFYAPIIVRNRESQGVMIWSMSQTIFNELYELFEDADYGDISNIKTGRDIEITYFPATSANTMAKTTIKPRGVQSPLSTDVEQAKA